MPPRSKPTKEAPPPDQSNLNPFLKASDLSNGSHIFMLTGWSRRVPAHVSGGISFPEQIVIEVQDADEKLYDFGVGVGSPNHKSLHVALGSDEKQWRGTITVEKRQGRNAPFVQIMEVAKRVRD